jgi:hypothetical protein
MSAGYVPDLADAADVASALWLEHPSSGMNCSVKYLEL